VETQHEDREASYLVIFCFIFFIKPGNCLYIVGVFVCRTTSGQTQRRSGSHRSRMRSDHTCDPVVTYVCICENVRVTYDSLADSRVSMVNVANTLPLPSC